MTAAAVLLAALAAWLWRSPAPEPRLRQVLGAGRPPPDGTPRGQLPVAAAVVAAVGAVALIGGVGGVAAAIGCLVLVPRLSRRLESRAGRRRREDLARQAPDVAELFAATLASGATPAAALAAMTAAIDEPMRSTLRPVLAALELGADPAQAWRGIDPSLRPVAQAVVRSAQSGAPLAQLLARLTDDMRRDRQQAVELAARAAGVRAVAPLGACFLPAFVLVGVVPVVVSLATGLLG